MALIGNQHTLAFVFDNIRQLQEHGLYEEALLSSYTRCRVNWSYWSIDVLRYMFSIADRQRLLDAGEPLPNNGPYIIYRGVAGNGRARRIKGISWTADFEKAQWFAERFSKMGDLKNPAVFKLSVNRENVFAYSNGREEQEFLIDARLENPKRVAVFTGTDA